MHPAAWSNRQGISSSAAAESKALHHEQGGERVSKSLGETKQGGLFCHNILPHDPRVREQVFSRGRKVLLPRWLGARDVHKSHGHYDLKTILQGIVILIKGQWGDAKASNRAFNTLRSRCCSCKHKVGTTHNGLPERHGYVAFESWLARLVEKRRHGD